MESKRLYKHYEIDYNPNNKYQVGYNENVKIKLNELYY